MLDSSCSRACSWPASANRRCPRAARRSSRCRLPRQRWPAACRSSRSRHEPQALPNPPGRGCCAVQAWRRRDGLPSHRQCRIRRSRARWRASTRAGLHWLSARFCRSPGNQNGKAPAECEDSLREGNQRLAEGYRRIGGTAATARARQSCRPACGRLSTTRRLRVSAPTSRAPAVLTSWLRGQGATAGALHLAVEAAVPEIVGDAPGGADCQTPDHDAHHQRCRWRCGWHQPEGPTRRHQQDQPPCGLVPAQKLEPGQRAGRLADHKVTDL